MVVINPCADSGDHNRCIYSVEILVGDFLKENVLKTKERRDVIHPDEGCIDQDMEGKPSFSSLVHVNLKKHLNRIRRKKYLVHFIRVSDASLIEMTGEIRPL
jgi:hypothetical protein